MTQSAPFARGCRSFTDPLGVLLRPLKQPIQPRRHLGSPKVIRLQCRFCLGKQAAYGQDIAYRRRATGNAQDRNLSKRPLRITDARKRMTIDTAYRAQRPRLRASLISAFDQIHGVTGEASNSFEIIQPFLVSLPPSLTSCALSSPDRNEDCHHRENCLDPGCKPGPLLDPLHKIGQVEQGIDRAGGRDDRRADGNPMLPSQGQQVGTLHVVKVGTILVKAKL